MESVKLIVPKIIKIYVSIIVFTVIFYFGLNIFLGITTFFNMSSLAKNVQDAVQNNGYLTTHDYKAFQNIIDMYTVTSGQNIEYKNQGIIGINKVVTNLMITVYDIDNKGYVHPDDYNNYKNKPIKTNSYYIGAEGRTNKKQQGQVLFAGIVFKYRIIHPINISNLARPKLNSINGAQIDQIFDSDGGETWAVGKTGDQAAKRMDTLAANENTDGFTLIDTTKLGYGSNSGATATDGSLFINPVVCTHFYADMISDLEYSGDD